jgi:hypothetical protein
MIPRNFVRRVLCSFPCRLRLARSTTEVQMNVPKYETNHRYDALLFDPLQSPGSGLDRKDDGKRKKRTAVLVQSIFSVIISTVTAVWRAYSHCDNIWRTSYVRCLILCTPGSNNIARVVAFVLDVCIIAHHVNGADRVMRLKLVIQIWSEIDVGR